jgi:hypothetical protein
MSAGVCLCVCLCVCTCVYVYVHVCVYVFVYVFVNKKPEMLHAEDVAYNTIVLQGSDVVCTHAFGIVGFELHGPGERRSTATQSSRRVAGIFRTNFCLILTSILSLCVCCAVLLLFAASSLNLSKQGTVHL